MFLFMVRGWNAFRGLLPDENFEDARLSSTGTGLDGEQASSSQSSQKNPSGVRIKSKSSLRAYPPVLYAPLILEIIY